MDLCDGGRCTNDIYLLWKNGVGVPNSSFGKSSSFLDLQQL